MIIPRKGEPIEKALRRLKKQNERENVIEDYLKHQSYQKPGDKKRNKRKKAEARRRKELRKLEKKKKRKFK